MGRHLAAGHHGFSLNGAAIKHYDQREQTLGDKLLRQLERFAILRVIDDRWREHLYEMDQHSTQGLG